MKYITTSYESPDLDGISGMYAYAEYLRKIGKDSDYYFEGVPTKEVQIVCELFNIILNPVKKEEIRDSKIIVLDTHLREILPKEIVTENIIEIIDHHIASENMKQYTNAKIQVELVGAAATLVVEKYKKNKISISRESATLLYYGIISNTINLKSNLTTLRDKEAIEWLQSQQDIDTTKVLEVFKKKSEILQENLRKELEIEIVYKYKKAKYLIGQIEIVEINEFLDNNEKQIYEIMKQVQLEKKPDYLLLNCIDIYDGYTVVLTIDTKSSNYFSDLLKYPIKIGRTKLDTIIMRKQYWQKIATNPSETIGNSKEE